MEQVDGRGKDELSQGSNWIVFAGKLRRAFTEHEKQEFQISRDNPLIIHIEAHIYPKDGTLIFDTRKATDTILNDSDVRTLLGHYGITGDHNIEEEIKLRDET